MSWKIYFIIFGIIILAGLFFLIFNDNGFLKYTNMKEEVSSLQLQLDSLNREVKNMKAEIDSLKNNSPAKIEKLAREKYHMSKPGESVIKIETTE